MICPPKKKARKGSGSFLRVSSPISNRPSAKKKKSEVRVGNRDRSSCLCFFPFTILTNELPPPVLAGDG